MFKSFKKLILLTAFLSFSLNLNSKAMENDDEDSSGLSHVVCQQKIDELESKIKFLEVELKEQAQFIASLRNKKSQKYMNWNEREETGFRPFLIRSAAFVTDIVTQTGGLLIRSTANFALEHPSIVMAFGFLYLVPSATAAYDCASTPGLFVSPLSYSSN